MIHSSQQEVAGLDKIAAAQDFLFAITRREALDAPLHDLDARVTPIAEPDPDGNAAYREARETIFGKWRALAPEPRAPGPLAELATKTAALIVKISDTSDLTYDPDEDGINFGDLLTTQLMRLFDQSSHGAALAAHLGSHPTPADRVSVVRYVAQSEISWMAAKNDFELGISLTAIPQDRMRRAHAKMRRTFETLTSHIDAIANGASAPDRAAIRVDDAAFTLATAEYARSLREALRGLFERRIAWARVSIALTVGLSLVTLGLGILADFSRRRTARQQLALHVETERRPRSRPQRGAISNDFR